MVWEPLAAVHQRVAQRDPTSYSTQLQSLVDHTKTCAASANSVFKVVAVLLQSLHFSLGGHDLEVDEVLFHVQSLVKYCT